MRISIVIAVLNSHEIFRRQLLHFEKLNLPDDIEFIFVDDGSDPILSLGNSGLKNVTLFQTNDKQPWTQPIARNKGADLARGEYLICTDIDHILSRDLIMTVYENTVYDIIRFKREVGVLDESGSFIQDMDELLRWGYKPKASGVVRIGPHGNSYAIRKELFIKFGGSQQRTRYPNRDEQKIKRWTHKLGGELNLLLDDGRPTIYMFPNGRFCGEKDFNPFGLFHNLSRKSDEG
jgi:glycosyltransferase involved in cell wall biosynthesis